MDSFLPPVVIEILASIKDFKAKKNELIGGLGEINAAGATTSAKLKHLGVQASNYVLLGAGAVGVMAVKMALDYNEAVESMGRQTNLTEDQIKKISLSLIHI